MKYLCNGGKIKLLEKEVSTWKNKKILYSLFNDCVKNYIQSKTNICSEYYELMINTESIFNIKTILNQVKIS